MGILLLIAIVILYGHLGYRLKKNYILWGLMGLGIIIAPTLLAYIIIAVSHSPLIGISLWPLSLLAGPLIGLIIAGIIVYRNNGAFKRSAPLEKGGSENPNS